MQTIDAPDAMRHLPPTALTRTEILSYREGVGLPATGGDYCPQAVPETPPSAQEILDGNRDLKECLGATAVLYGPEKEAAKDRIAREQQARQMCGRCALIEPCLEVALSVRMDRQYGFQGGLTARERRRLIRQRSQQTS